MMLVDEFSPSNHTDLIEYVLNHSTQLLILDFIIILILDKKTNENLLVWMMKTQTFYLSFRQRPEKKMNYFDRETIFRFIILLFLEMQISIQFNFNSGSRHLISQFFSIKIIRISTMIRRDLSEISTKVNLI